MNLFVSQESFAPTFEGTWLSNLRNEGTCDNSPPGFRCSNDTPSSDDYQYVITCFENTGSKYITDVRFWADSFVGPLEIVVTKTIDGSVSVGPSSGTFGTWPVKSVVNGENVVTGANLGFDLITVTGAFCVGIVPSKSFPVDPPQTPVSNAGLKIQSESTGTGSDVPFEGRFCTATSTARPGWTQLPGNNFCIEVKVKDPTQNPTVRILLFIEKICYTYTKPCTKHKV